MHIYQCNNLIDLIKSNQLNENHLTTIKKNIYFMFKYSCIRGHLDVAKWLYELAKNNGNTININAEGEYVFKFSCCYGFLDVAKWLYELSKADSNTVDQLSKTIIDIHIDNEYAFIWSCSNGHLDVAKWLYEISKIDNKKINIHTDHELAFRFACRNGHIYVAKWLYELSKIDDNIEINIHTYDDYAFRESCNENHLNVADWLCTICNNYKIIQKNNKLIPYIRNLKTILIENDLQEIEKLYENSEYKSKNDICIMCLRKDKKYWIRLNCGHEICSLCFINIERCPYRCADIIGLSETKLIKKSNKIKFE